MYKSIQTYTPKEIAKEFNCCENAIRKAFNRLGITRKKEGKLPGTGSGKGKGLLVLDPDRNNSLQALKFLLCSIKNGIE